MGEVTPFNNWEEDPGLKGAQVATFQATQTDEDQWYIARVSPEGTVMKTASDILLVEPLIDRTGLIVVFGENNPQVITAPLGLLSHYQPGFPVIFTRAGAALQLESFDSSDELASYLPEDVEDTMTFVRAGSAMELEST